MDINDITKQYEESNIYLGLIKDSHELSTFNDVVPCDMDSMLSSNKIKVASLGDLSNFFRLSSDTLVHKAEKDLWRISEDNGQVVIERLFDPSGQPIRV